MEANQRTARRMIAQIVRDGMARLDDEHLMVVRKRVHHHTVDVPDGWYHETRDSTFLALALLEWAAQRDDGDGDEAYEGPPAGDTSAIVGERLTPAAAISTAEGIVSAVYEAQNVVDPVSPTYGLWHYYAELPVDGWEYKDFNWADFIGTGLLQIAFRHGARLSAETNARIRECVDRAARCVLRRNVSVGYTNISALAGFVLSGAGELLDSQEYRAAGRSRVEKMTELVAEQNVVDEYFSPGYTGVALMGLLSIGTFVTDGETRAAARRVELSLWNHVALGWDAAARELAGPHSRAYSVRMGFSWVAALLYRSTDGAIDWPDAPRGEFLITSCLVQRVTLPPELLDAILAPPTPRSLDQPGEAHPTDDGPRRTRYRLYVTSEGSLGSVDLQDSRTDRQNVVGYWNSGRHNSDGSGSGYVIVRTRKDDDEGAFGLYVAADQHRGDVLVGVFPGEFEDPSPMRPRDGADTAWMESVVEIADPGAGLIPRRLDGRQREGSPTDPAVWDSAEGFLLVRCGAVDLALRELDASGLGAHSVEITTAGDRVTVARRWYDGDHRRVAWRELAGKRFVVFMSLRDPAEPFADWTRRLGGMSFGLAAADGEWIAEVRSDAAQPESGHWVVRMPNDVLPMRTLYARYLRA